MTGSNGLICLNPSGVLLLDLCARVLSIINTMLKHRDMYITKELLRSEVEEQLHCCVIRPLTLCLGHLSEERGKAVNRSLASSELDVLSEEEV